MTRPRLVLAAAAVLALVGASDALACGDKFLVSTRGTRYQRPKNARAASILIYVGPGARLEAKGKTPIETMLKREGHRSTIAETAEQLAALMTAGRFDVVLAAASALDAVTTLVHSDGDAPVVVALDSPVKEGSLLRAVDRAVAQRDRNARRSPLKG